MAANTRYLFSVLLIQLCAFTTSAQKLIFGQLGVQQGLPATEVYNLSEDGKGYIWAFTEYGMVRHNGTRFQPICTNLPFAEAIVYKVAVSPHGTMYLANSKANIYRVQGDSAVRIRGLEAVSKEILDQNKVIFDLAIDNDSTIYLSTNAVSWKFDQRTGRTCKLSKPHKVNDITFRPIGTGFFALKSFLPAYFLEKHFNLNVILEDHRRLCSIVCWNHHESRNILMKSGDRYAIMIFDQIIIVSRDGTSQHIELPKATLTMQIAPNGHIWVGMAYGGLLELSADLRILNHYFEDEAVSGILFDRQGGLWVSTIDRGVFYCKNSRNASYNHIRMLDDCISLLKRVDGRLFVGTTKGNLFVCEKGGMRPVDLGVHNAPLTDVIRFGDQYFIGMKKAILQTDLHFRNVRSLAPIFGAYSFAESAGDQLVIAAATQLLTLEKGETFVRESRVIGRPRHLVCRSRKDVFVGTHDGVLLLKQGKTLCPDYLQALRGINVSKLKTGPGNVVWICTKGNGLYKLSPNNKLIHYTGLPSIVTTDICFLPDNVVVLSTNKGVFVTILKNEHFSSWTLLLEEETINLAEYRGKLYIGTKNGLVVRNISSLLHAREYPFYLRSVVADGKVVNHRERRFSHRQNDLYFNFDMLAYQLSYKQVFYRLEGPSPGSGKVNGTQLHLQNLAPGRYVLHASPYNHLTRTQQRGLVLVFYIEPAFWQTNLFLGSIVFTTIVLIVGITWTIFHRTRRRAETRSRITRLLAGYRLTALKAQINPHFISNSLAAIQQLILRNDTDRANHYIAQFSLLIRYLLNYSDKSVASLHDELRIIRLNVELEQLRFSDQFAFETIIADDVRMQELFIPPLITQPFIENAIWHGLLPLTGQRNPTLTLKMTIENGRLVIAIIDNGVGRKKKAAGLPPEYGDRESKGTELIMNRIDNLNRLHAANGAVIELKDLTDEQGNPTGTQVNILFSLEMLNTLYDEQDQEHYY